MMLIGRVLTDGRMSARVKYDITDRLSLKMNAQVWFINFLIKYKVQLAIAAGQSYLNIHQKLYMNLGGGFTFNYIPYVHWIVFVRGGSSNMQTPCIRRIVDAGYISILLHCKPWTMLQTQHIQECCDISLLST